MGVATRTVALWIAEGMPGAQGAYCVEDCESWRRSKGDRRKTPDDDDDDAAIAQAQSPHLEKLRKYKALQERDKYRIQHGTLIPADTVQRMMQRAAGVIRSFSVRLGRVSPEMQAEFEQVLSELEGIVDQVIDGEDGISSDMAADGEAALS